MKIISADSLSRNDSISDLLKHMGEGIVLLGEGAFDMGDGDIPDSELPKVIEVTKSYPISIVSTKDNGKSVTAYIIKKGQILSAQKSFYFHLDPRRDILYDVSPSNIPIKALIRICADGGDEYTGSEKAELFLLPHACWLGKGNNLRNIGSPELAEIHLPSLKKNALIVTADTQNGNQPIYDLEGRIVSKQKQYQGFQYHEAVLRID